MVGVAGFEPTTPCPPDKCATGLRYTPNNGFLRGLLAHSNILGGSVLKIF